AIVELRLAAGERRELVRQQRALAGDRYDGADVERLAQGRARAVNPGATAAQRHAGLRVDESHELPLGRQQIAELLDDGACARERPAGEVARLEAGVDEHPAHEADVA